jgi:serine/threonine protein kinase
MTNSQARVASVIARGSPGLFVWLRCSLMRPLAVQAAWTQSSIPVEEYVNKGDVLNEAISHPDKYTERFVALNVVKPLLSVLAYMHANNIIHR